MKSTDVGYCGFCIGATSPSLILTGVNTGMNNRFYRCVATADCGLSTNSGVGILFVGIPDTTVNVNGITLTSAASNAVYRWLDCGNGYAPVSGATGQSFTPVNNGNYALEITKNGCTDTSSCYNISSVGLVETFGGRQIFIYPIPATNDINIKIEKSGEHLIGIYDINGRMISPEQVFQHGISLSLEGMESGSYLVGIRNQQEKLKFFRFIKN